jgi:hypothetical protein
MSRQVDTVSSSTGMHYILIGYNQNELASFSLMMWITHYGQRAIDWVQALSQGFCTFMGGDIYEHNDPNVPRATLFGERKDVKVGIVANQDANVIKLLDSIGIHSDENWEIESITIPKTLNQPHGMYSRLPKGRFVKREGVWRAAFLRNMKSTSDTISTIQAISGESLRGNSAYLVLKNTSTTEVKLFKIDINMTSSR